VGGRARAPRGRRGLNALPRPLAAEKRSEEKRREAKRSEEKRREAKRSEETRREAKRSEEKRREASVRRA